jgi:hypothetical protein
MCIILTDIWAHKRKSDMEKANQIWRIETNEELDKLMKHKNIVNCINPLNAELNPSAICWHY